MKMAGSKVDTNFKNGTFREHFNQKQKFEAESVLLFHTISDLKLSEYFHHNKDTDTYKKEQNIYSSQTEEIEEQIDDAEPKDDDAEPKDDDAEPKVDHEEVHQYDNNVTNAENDPYLIIFVVGCIIIVLLIGLGIFFYFSSKGSPAIEKPIAKIQRKCKEYTDLACSLKPPKNKNSSQIVRGNRVPHQWMFPHQVYMRTPKGTRIYQCGGALINEKFVLTAAHCARNGWLDRMKVQLGRLIVNDSDLNTNPKMWKKVKKIHMHPNFNDTFESDICLLELEEKVKFSSDVRPICLNTKFETNYDSMIATGWGEHESGLDSDYLRMVELHINNESVEYCHKEFETQYKNFNRMTICLAHRKQGIARGDSGSPLQVKLKSKCENTWEQIGVVSMVLDFFYEDDQLTGSLFSKVDYFIPWIASVAWPD